MVTLVLPAWRRTADRPLGKLEQTVSINGVCAADEADPLARRRLPQPAEQAASARQTPDFRCPGFPGPLSTCVRRKRTSCRAFLQPERRCAHSTPAGPRSTVLLRPRKAANGSSRWGTSFVQPVAIRPAPMSMECPWRQHEGSTQRQVTPRGTGGEATRRVRFADDAAGLVSRLRICLIGLG